MIAWEACVALIARRRPVPLIIYAIGLLATGLVAAILIAAHVRATQIVLAASVVTGFVTAAGFVIIWQLAPASAQGGTRTATRVGRTLIVRGLAFSAIVFVLSLIVRAVRHGG
jgi:hypothetical protein